MAKTTWNVPIFIDQEQYDRDVAAIQKKIDAIPNELDRNWAAASDEAAKEILMSPGIVDYPIQKIGVPQPFKTDKSRRYFFAALRRGEITVPYRRGQGKSQTYGKQWYVETSGMTATIANRATYARYLAGETEQSAYMKARGWRKIKEVADEKLPEIIKIYEGWTGRALKNLKLVSEGD